MVDLMNPLRPLLLLIFLQSFLLLVFHYEFLGTIKSGLFTPILYYPSLSFFQFVIFGLPLIIIQVFICNKSHHNYTSTHLCTTIHTHPTHSQPSPTPTPHPPTYTHPHYTTPNPHPIHTQSTPTPPSIHTIPTSYHIHHTHTTTKLYTTPTLPLNSSHNIFSLLHHLQVFGNKWARTRLPPIIRLLAAGLLSLFGFLLISDILVLHLYGKRFLQSGTLYLLLHPNTFLANYRPSFYEFFRLFVVFGTFFSVNLWLMRFGITSPPPPLPPCLLFSTIQDFTFFSSPVIFILIFFLGMNRLHGRAMRPIMV